MHDSLEPHQIKICCAFYDELRDPELLSSYREILSEQERQQEQRFRHARLKHRYLITRALVRTELSRHFPLHPSLWRFEPNPYGRPLIQNPEVQRQIIFNLSHTEDLIILGIRIVPEAVTLPANGFELGLDVENLLRAAPLEVASHFFSPAEVSDLQELPETSQHQRFFQYWTLKEAYIKARSMGLSIPLDQFAYAIAESKVRLTIDSRLHDQASRWNLWQFSIAQNFMFSVCAEKNSYGPAEFIFKKTQPLCGETALEYTLQLSGIENF